MAIYGRLEDVTEVGNGLTFANRYNGQTAKVPYPVVIRDDSIVGCVTQPCGWRRRAGYWGVVIYVSSEERLSFETKDRQKAINMMVELARNYA